MIGRRNLSDYQRGVLALRMKPIMEKRAEAKRLDGNARGGKSSQISDATIDAPVEKFRADEAVSELANVSRDTIRKIERIEAKKCPPQGWAVIRNAESVTFALSVLPACD